MLRSFLLCSLLLALVCASPAQKTTARFLVMNATPDTKFSHKRSALETENVAGLVGHMMGVYGHALPEDLPATNFFRQPKANLMVVVDGAPSSADSDLSNLALFDADFETPESSSKALSMALSGQVAGPETEAITLGNLLCQLNENSAVLSLSTNAALLNAVAVPNQLLQKNPKLNVFGALFDAKKNKLSLSGKSDSEVQKTLENLYACAGLEQYSPLENGKPLFDESIQEEKLFMVEMKALSNLIASLQQGELAALLKDSHPDLITFMSVSLKGLSQKYGENSIEYTAAWAKLKEVISKIQEEFPAAFDNQGIFEVMLLNTQADTSSRARRSIHKRDYTNIAAPCFPTAEACQNSTSNCSSFGQCTIAKQSQDSVCYRCKCKSEYAGDSCEFINIVAPFHIIFWTSLLIILALILVTSSLAYMDPGTDTLLFRTVTPKAKKE